MDGKGSWRDYVFVERFWRTLKYEEVYLKAYESVVNARLSIGRYLEFHNGRRPHSSLYRRTPDQAYYASLPCAWQHNYRVVSGTPIRVLGTASHMLRRMARWGTDTACVGCRTALCR
jgi:putative transposase